MDRFSLLTYPFVVRYDVSESSQRAKGQSHGRGHHKKWTQEEDAGNSPLPKRFKSSHPQRHSQYQSNVDQSLYPRGSSQDFSGYSQYPSNTDQTPYPRGSQHFSGNTHHDQRYHHSPSSSYSRPQQHSNFKSTSKFNHHRQCYNRNEPHSGQASSSRGAAQPQPQQLSRSAKKFVNSTVDADEFSTVGQRRKGGKKRSKAYDDSHDDWDGGSIAQAQPAKARKKGKNVPKKTWDKGGSSWQASPKDSRSQKQFEEKSHSKRQKKKKNKKMAHSEPSGSKPKHQKDSLIVTSSAGFRTVAKTIKLNRNYRNAQF